MRWPHPGIAERCPEGSRGLQPTEQGPDYRRRVATPELRTGVPDSDPARRHAVSIEPHRSAALRSSVALGTLETAPVLSQASLRDAAGFPILFRGLKPTATFTLSLRDRRTGVLAAADLAGDPVQNVKHSSRFPIERKPSRGGAAGPKAWPFAASLFGPPGVETSN